MTLEERLRGFDGAEPQTHQTTLYGERTLIIVVCPTRRRVSGAYLHRGEGGMAPSHSVTETADKQSFVSLKGGQAKDLMMKLLKAREIEGGIFTLYLRRAWHAAH